MHLHITTNSYAAQYIIMYIYEFGKQFYPSIISFFVMYNLNCNTYNLNQNI